MSLKTQLQAAIDYCNTKLAAKGAQTASTVYGIGDMIETIQTGGGTSDWEKIEITAPSATTTVDAFYSAYIETYAEALADGYSLVYYVSNNSSRSYSARMGIVANLGGIISKFNIRQNSGTVQIASGTSTFGCGANSKITIYIGKSQMLDIWS